MFLGFCSGAAASNVSKKFLSEKDKQIIVLIHIALWPLFLVLNFTITFFELIHRRYK